MAVLIEVKSHIRKRTKARLVEQRGHRCEGCQGTEWRGRPIPLEVHHLNESDDDDQLQLLCPNCHAQTPNYRGKNKKSAKMLSRICACGKDKNERSPSCRSCGAKRKFAARRVVPVAGVAPA